MQADNLPTWLAVGLFLFGSLSALYLCYIRPGYYRDRNTQ